MFRTILLLVLIGIASIIPLDFNEEARGGMIDPAGDSQTADRGGMIDPTGDD